MTVRSGGVPAEKLVESAHALTVFRALKNGEGRRYTAVTFPQDPWCGCERMLRMFRAVGWIGSEGEPYAVLDVLNEAGDIVQDFPIPNAQAFQRIKRKLNLAVERDDDLMGVPASPERPELAD